MGFSVNHFIRDRVFYSISFLLVLLLLLAGCSGSKRGLFAGRTPHEKYIDKLKNAGLSETALGRTWISVADKALRQPLSVQLPYKETGYFPAATPDAAGYRFTANRGDQLVIKCTKKPATGFSLFLELWRPQSTEAPELLQAADSAVAGILYEVKSDGDYQLRLQPELLAGGEYTITIETAPSLAFPIETLRDPRIGSFWGDVRDGGARNHQGIDIFSRFRTPAIAAAAGRVRRVGTNNLGGKVVFLKPDGKDYVLYYAHLDSQMVRTGQQVNAGDTIGLIGNTGNARNTPPHLHFGIYTSGGAIDPLPFVKRERPTLAPITVATSRLNDTVRSNRNAVFYTSPNKGSAKTTLSDAWTPMWVKAATGSLYKVHLPDGREGFIADNSVNPMDGPVQSFTVKFDKPLLDKPDSLHAATKTLIAKNEKVEVLGVYQNYYFIKNDKETGWIAR